MSVFHTIRENVALKFNEICNEANDTAAKLNIEPKPSRIRHNQRNRSNVPCNTIEGYYKKSIFVPNLNGLNERFIPPQRNYTIALQFILLCVVVEIPFFLFFKLLDFNKK